MTSLTDRLHWVCIGGCTCMTKTPELEHHTEDCRYRIAAEAIVEIERLTSELTKAHEALSTCITGSHRDLRDLAMTRAALAWAIRTYVPTGVASVEPIHIAAIMAALAENPDT